MNKLVIIIFLVVLSGVMGEVTLPQPVKKFKYNHVLTAEVVMEDKNNKSTLITLAIETERDSNQRDQKLIALRKELQLVLEKWAKEKKGERLTASTNTYTRNIQEKKE